jgi:hypothetical protein
MKKMKICVVLLALLLAAMAIVPMVSAVDQNTAGVSPDSMSALTIDVSKIQTPLLQFNTTQMKVVVSGELNPKDTKSTAMMTNVESSQSSTVPSIPYGAIIYHSKDGVTTVFDSTGKQLFAADDAKAAKLSTGAPATYVHEIPSGSIEQEYQGKTYVTYGGKLILTIINEDDTKTNTVSAAPLALSSASVTSPYYSGWIEYAQSSIVTADRFDSTWVAPTKTPVNYGVRQSLAIYNGIQRSGIDGIMQPVLMWNFDSFNDQTLHLNYVGAAWDFQSTTNPNKDSLHSTPIAVSPGQTVEGSMIWSPTLNCWLIQFKNVATGQTTAFYTYRFPRDNLQLFYALEATGQGIQKTTGALTGSISFQNNYIQYQGGNVPITFTGYTGSGASSIFNGLNPSVSTYPSLQVNLGTGR